MAEHQKGWAASHGAAARKGLEGLGGLWNGTKETMATIGAVVPEVEWNKAPERSGAPESPTAGGTRDTSTLPTRCRCRRGTRPNKKQQVYTELLLLATIMRLVQYG